MCQISYSVAPFAQTFTKMDKNNVKASFFIGDVKQDNICGSGSTSRTVGENSIAIILVTRQLYNQPSGKRHALLRRSFRVQIPARAH